MIDRVMNRGVMFFALVFVAVLAFASVSAIPQTINLHGRLSNSSSGNALTGPYNMNFTIYDAYTGGNAIYNKVASVVTGSDGIYNFILTDVNLNFSSQYYVEIKVENEVMAPRINLTSSPYAFMAQNVSVGGITYDGNMDLGANNITTTGYGWFGFLGSASSRISKLWVNEINASGNIVTLGNVSAGYFIGDGSRLTGVATSTGWTNDTLSTNTSLNVVVAGNTTIDGRLAIGTSPIANTLLRVSGNNASRAIGISFPVSNSTSGNEYVGIGGYPVLLSGNYSGKSVSGLNFGTYSQFSVITGKPNMRGIQVFGYGDLGSYSDLGDVYSIDVENMRLFSDDISATSWTGIKIRDGVGSGYFTSLPIQTQLDIDKPTSATGNNYQMVLQGGGVGSGIWFNGTTGQRVYSDGVTLNINSSLNISNTLNTNTISSSGNSNVTITSSGGSVIIKLG